MIFEVAYGKLDEQALLSIESAEPLTAEQAIEASGILQMFPEIDLKANKIGIFGKAAKLDTVLSEGDRVEIYRPLIADPKEARKKRAAEGKVMRKGGGEKK
ncbi:MAG: RnfH family protein [Candidatus Thiodiazotropha endolucinida]|nr:RnfH family protein [Candidatus Thiodiazotropha sp. (ex Cardiolucina cf. quadrata)]